MCLFLALALTQPILADNGNYTNYLNSIQMKIKANQNQIQLFEKNINNYENSLKNHTSRHCDSVLTDRIDILKEKIATIKSNNEVLTSKYNEIINRVEPENQDQVSK